MSCYIHISIADPKAKVILATFLHLPFSVFLNLCWHLSWQGSLPDVMTEIFILADSESLATLFWGLPQFSID